ncbi:hypothetical protein N7457_000181 [Penicillium paradoxum]|uniref:uncharacterized protein n=1 Tax=Penicillium paradoxum TaxID=176176 RepID=UPI002546B198|nr:uncharacterized protein N7457_000181 [Penicillium paradoxum]KAJ5793582.1 hypothetical protein N7457_000181 [Penicillium paradoxum]
MASVPEYSAAGRTRSFDGTTLASSDGSSTHQENASAQDGSMEELEGTETVFLNKDISTPSHGPETSTKSLTQSSKSSHASDDDEPRKCWICYTDETEDSPLNLEWRSPCPCALTAHEACLLDWLADMENPRSRRNSTAKMTCPQCKTEIVVARPRSYVVDGLRLIERAAGRLVLPGMMFTVAGTLWAGCLVHGVYSMQIVFGPEEATELFDEVMNGPWSPSMAVGLPLIPLVLIFSRTRYGSGLLPAIPILFFTSHHPGPATGELWPPSPAMAFSTLPYIKCFYGLVYDRIFGPLERKWIAEVQPRATEETLDDAQEQDQAEGLNRFDDEGDGNFLMEIDLQLQMGLGDGDDVDLELPMGQNEDADGGGPNEQAQDADQNNGLGLGRHRHEIINDTSNLADIVLGALVFPAIAASMGGLLKYALPAAWTTPTPQSTLTSIFGRARAGILQSRWGRSIVGGCMFVLLKDALVLYCRWKLAQGHRRRKVLNYEQAKKHLSTRRSAE